ncbi:MAG: alanine racemase [Acidobacteria bacterium]|nr:alanine racemase [Acidobacteriota bacterium]
MKRRQFLITGAAAAAFPRIHVQDSRPAVNSDVWIEVNLRNIGWNLSQIRSRCGNRPVMAVIKANGYGHGVGGLSQFLVKQNIAGLLVTTIDEAAQALPSRSILHFGALTSADAAEWLVRNDVSQALYTVEGLELLKAAATRLRKRPGVHLVIDTGLGRLGVSFRDAMRFIERVRDVNIRGTMMTFTEETEFDKEQLRRFNSVVDGMKQRGINPGVLHAASSDAILNLPESYLDMVRPGIMLYGHYPSEGARQKKEIELRPAAAWKTRVAYVKTLQPGDSVGYHRPYRAEREETVATLPVGYSDGHRPAVAGKADVWLNGRRCPIIAPITANHTIVRIPPDLAVKPGDEVELMGPNVPAYELANHAGISVYQMVIGLSAARPRSYVET